MLSFFYGEKSWRIILAIRKAIRENPVFVLRKCASPTMNRIGLFWSTVMPCIQDDGDDPAQLQKVQRGVERRERCLWGRNQVMISAGQIPQIKHDRTDLSDVLLLDVLQKGRMVAVDETYIHVWNACIDLVTRRFDRLLLYIDGIDPPILPHSRG